MAKKSKRVKVPTKSGGEVESSPPRSPERSPGTPTQGTRSPNRRGSPGKGSPGKGSPGKSASARSPSRSPTRKPIMYSASARTISARAPSSSTRVTLSSRASPTGSSSGRYASPSSLARSTSPILQMSPSQREAVDKKRSEIRAAKRGLSPGPAHYDPHQVSSTSQKLSGHYAFRSTSGRIVSNLLKDKGDPGAYEAEVYLSLARQATSSFSKSSKSGMSSFNSHEERILEFNRAEAWNEGEKTPGPAAYTPQLTEAGKEFEMQVRSGVETMKSSSFASTTERKDGVALTHMLSNPGPGAYDPNYDSVDVTLPENPISKVNRDARFTGDGIGRSAQTGPEVGPGSYDSHDLYTISGDLNASLKVTSSLQQTNKPGEGSVGFGSRFEQHQLPHEAHVGGAIPENVPGPGAYAPRMTEKGASFDVGLSSDKTHKNTSAFMPGEVSKDMGWDSAGDPGAYEPSHPTIAAAVSQTFQTSSKKGKAAFGATTMRSLRIPPDMARTGISDETPGPAAYETMSHRVFSRPMASFRSSLSKLGSFLLPSAPNPGPGSYDPNFDAIEAKLPENPISKVNRDARFTGDGIGRSAQTGPEVGPGSYEAQLDKTIGAGSGAATERSGRYKLASKISEKLGWSSSSKQHQLPHEMLNRTEFKHGVGPGSYSPEIAGPDRDLAQGALATFHKPGTEGKGFFGTKAPARGMQGAYDQTKAMGDPGSYDPYDGSMMAQTARATFNRSSKAGKGDFGAHEKREFRHEGAYNGQPNGPGFRADIKNPGVGTYTPQLTEAGKEFEMQVRNGVETMKSSSFASKVERTNGVALTHLLDNPGPGAYDPNYDSVEVKLPENPISKVNRDARFTGDGIGRSAQTGPEVGPGSYELQRDYTGELNTMGLRAEEKASWGWSAWSLSTHIRSLWQGWVGDNDELNSA